MAKSSISSALKTAASNLGGGAVQKAQSNPSFEPSRASGPLPQPATPTATGSSLPLYNSTSSPSKPSNNIEGKQTGIASNAFKNVFGSNQKTVGTANRAANNGLGLLNGPGASEYTDTLSKRAKRAGGSIVPAPGKAQNWLNPEPTYSDEGYVFGNPANQQLRYPDTSGLSLEDNLFDRARLGMYTDEELARFEKAGVDPSDFTKHAVDLKLDSIANPTSQMPRPIGDFVNWDSPLFSETTPEGQIDAMYRGERMDPILTADMANPTEADLVNYKFGNDLDTATAVTDWLLTQHFGGAYDGWADFQAHATEADLREIMNDPFLWDSWRDWLKDNEFIGDNGIFDPDKMIDWAYRTGEQGGVWDPANLSQDDFMRVYGGSSATNLNDLDYIVANWAAQDPANRMYSIDPEASDDELYKWFNTMSPEENPDYYLSPDWYAKFLNNANLTRLASSYEDTGWKNDFSQEELADLLGNVYTPTGELIEYNPDEIDPGYYKGLGDEGRDYYKRYQESWDPNYSIYTNSPVTLQRGASYFMPIDMVQEAIDSAEDDKTHNEKVVGEWANMASALSPDQFISPFVDLTEDPNSYQARKNQYRWED